MNPQCTRCLKVGSSNKEFEMNKKYILSSDKMSRAQLVVGRFHFLKLTRMFVHNQLTQHVVNMLLTAFQSIKKSS